jgi:hypothetical protein
LVTKGQLDQLEEHGYLGPNRRGERLDECDAIEMFLADALASAPWRRISSKTATPLAGTWPY